MFKHILFPTDGSDASNSALTKAAQLARSLGARLTALNVTGIYHRAYASERFSMPELKALRKRFEDEETAHGKELLAEVTKLAAQMGVTCNAVAVVSDTPYRAIIEQASKLNCDAIVMASHGRRGLEGLLLGSVTQQVLTHSTVPVLVCR
jgi:nucleotide-binding universal stress UspA family protein